MSTDRLTDEQLARLSAWLAEPREECSLGAGGEYPTHPCVREVPSWVLGLARRAAAELTATREMRTVLAGERGIGEALYEEAAALRAAIAEAEAEAAGQAHRQAHSKSEYRRLQAGGVDVLPPAAQAPPDEEWIDETIHAHIPFLRGARPYVAEAARAIASRLRAREEAVQQLCDAVERLQFGSAVAEQELRDALAAVREKP